MSTGLKEGEGEDTESMCGGEEVKACGMEGSEGGDGRGCRVKV